MISEYKIKAFKKPVADLDDNPAMSAGELKAHFDSNSYELLDALNSLIDALGADNSLAEFKLDGKGIDELLDEIKDMISGKADAENVRSAVENIMQKLDTKANNGDVSYKLSLKANTADVETQLSGKVDKVAGKGLSTNDFSNMYKAWLEDSMQYMGKSTEDNLPEYNAKGEVYRLPDSYAIHNGTSFDKVYTAETMDKKLDNTLELIETITITEDGISEVMRNKEPDGTPYNFKAMTLYQTVTPCEVENLVILRVYDNEEATKEATLTDYQVKNTKTSNGRFIKAHFDVIGGSWVALGVGTTIQGSPTNMQMWKDIIPYKTGQTIKSIKFKGHNVPLEVGTELQIYGVRA